MKMKIIDEERRSVIILFFKKEYLIFIYVKYIQQQ